MAKRFWVSLIGLTCFSGIALGQRDYLCLYSKNQANNRSWPINEVRKMTFSQDAIQVFMWQGTAPYVLDYGNMRKLAFEEQPIINNLQQTSVRNLHLRYDATSRKLLIDGMAGNGQIQLFAISGTLVLSAAVGMEQTEISFADVPNGLYVARLTDGKETQTIKLQIQ